MTTTTLFIRNIFITVIIFSSIFTNASALGTVNAPKQSIVAPSENLANVYAFDAVVINNKSINLNWITKSEENNIHFEVERSFDNNNFKTVALVLDGFSTDTDQKSYKFKENKAELKGKTTAYYRLKQIGSNGTVTFSKTIFVTLSASQDDLSFQGNL